MAEKKKNDEVKNKDWLIFILVWVTIVGIVQSQLTNASDLGKIAINLVFLLPEIFRRHWLSYLLKGLIGGLALGFAQKLIIKSYQPGSLKYWVRVTVLLTVFANLLEIYILRYILHNDLIRAPLPDPLLPYPFIPIISTIVVLGQWLILRKYFRQAWLWLLIVIPNYLAVGSFAYDDKLIPFFQAFLAASVLLWLLRYDVPNEKAKNISENLSRLNDISLDEDEKNEEINPIVAAQQEALGR